MCSARTLVRRRPFVFLADTDLVGPTLADDFTGRGADDDTINTRQYRDRISWSLHHRGSCGFLDKTFLNKLHPHQVSILPPRISGL